MTCRSLPAGLLDLNIEFFHNGENIEKMYALMGGKVAEFCDLPNEIKAIGHADIARNPDKLDALMKLGYEYPDEQLEKYMSCNFGSFDGEPDMNGTQLLTTEYWPCPNRGSCPVEGVLCNAFALGNGEYLTKRELEVLILVAQGYANKEIAGKLYISEDTVARHNKHIQDKGNFFRKPEMVAFAYKRNLL